MPGMPSREDGYYLQRLHDFEQLDRMRDHWWWRPGWRAGRRLYTWYVTFEDAAELHRLAAVHQRRISTPTLDPVPAEGLHLTLQTVGFTDEVPDADVHAIAEQAGSRCARLAPFTVTLGPTYADPETVLLRVALWDPVEQLRLTIRDAIAAVWGQDRVPGPAAGFHPHVTLCYSNADADSAPLRTVLADLRDLPPATARIHAAKLVRLDRDQHVYRWTTVSSAPLSGRTATRSTPPQHRF
jgi:2'-5' RNA ligase